MAALRTISLRLRGTSVKELEEAGEDTTGAITSKSKLRGKVKSLSGVDILTDTGAYKSTYDILLDISKVWEDMSDIDQAALLELIAGKTRSNTAAAILSNTEDLEGALKAAKEAEGSALRENEKYLDSIQGRIDLLTNATQTMWNNMLDSDVIKFFVNIATELVKFIDKIGLLGTALGGVFIYLTAFKKQTPVALLKQLWGVIQNIGTSIKTNGFGRWLGSLVGVVPKLKLVTAETVNNTLAIQTNDAAKTKQMMTDMGLIGVTGTLSVAQRQQARDVTLNAMATGQLTMAQGNAMLAMLGYSAATVAADGSLKTLDVTTKSFMATNPIGWILAIISVIATVAMLISQIPSKLERLTEKLSDLKSQLQETQSELSSVNSELETTQDRMAELLALPSLSFTEQEELDRLREENEELERRERILKAQEERQKKEIAETAKETLNAQLDKTYYAGSVNRALSVVGGSLLLGGPGAALIASITELLTNRVSFEDDLNFEIGEYDTLSKEKAKLEGELTDTSLSDKEYEKKKKKLAEIEEQLSKKDSYIDGRLSELAETIDGVEYGYGADEALDRYWNLAYKREIQTGTIGAKSDGLGHIFSRPEHDAAKESIDEYVKALKDGDASAAESIKNIIENNDALVADIQAMGLEIQDAVDYFTKSSSSLSEEIIANYDKGLNAINKFKDNGQISFLNDEGVTESIGFENLFNREGEILSTQISKVMQGADETTREEFESLMKAVKDGKYNIEDELGNISVDWESVAKTWNISGGLRVIEEDIARLSEVNIEVFPGLKDEISGIIDSFDELVSAVSDTVSAMDTLKQARAEEEYSGSVSLETLEKLMTSTENYADLIEVDETGAIKLATNAQDILVQEKINAIKQNAALALAEAQLRLEEAKHNQQIYQDTSPAQEVLRSILSEVGGAAAFVTSLWGDLTSGNLIGAWDRAKEARNSAITSKQESWAQQGANAAASVTEAEKAVANAQKMNDIAQGLTADNIKSKYDSSTASGGTNNPEDAAKQKVEDGWEDLINIYERQLGLISNERDLIEAEIDKAEARGGKASKQYYDDLIRNSQEEKAWLEDKKASLEAYLERHKDSIDPETWVEYNNEINATAVAIKECETNTIEWGEALREIDIHYFEQTTDEISRLGEELDFVNGLLEDEDVANENGNWTDAGLTRLGLYTQQMEKAAVEAKMYQDEIDDLNEQYENGELSEEQYQERLGDLTNGLQDSIQAQQDARDSIIELNEARIDAIKEGIEKEIKAYEDYIDVIKEALDAERDLYDFKKNVQKQSKDIASLERRIAALSGSTNAADIAERRKLEAQLFEAKEGLNDTYYDHAKDAQLNALDDEAEAFSQSKEKYIEELEATLEDVETLISNSIMDVVLNADTVLATLNETSATYGISLSNSLKTPWVNASAQATAWKNELEASMTSGEYAALIGEGGAITAFANGVADSLSGSWTTVQNAAEGYADFLTGTELSSRFSNTITGFGAQIQTIIDKWDGVKTAADNAYTAQTTASTVGGNPSIPSSGSSSSVFNADDGCSMPSHDVEKLQEILNTVFNENLGIDGVYGPNTTAAVRRAQATMGIGQDGYYGPNTQAAMRDYIKNQWQAGNGSSSAIGQAIKDMVLKLPTSYYAKGTLGTSHDEWAITDEIGDELVLIPGANGNLSFMRKGTSVVPADITANLIKWGKLNPNMMKVGGGANFNMISNAVNKPEFSFAFDSLVHVDHCDQGTIKDLEKMVDNKINQFNKQLNYALRGKGAR